MIEYHKLKIKVQPKRQPGVIECKNIKLSITTTTRGSAARGSARGTAEPTLPVPPLSTLPVVQDL